MVSRLTLVAVAALALAAPVRAANWNVSRVNHMLLTPPAGVKVQEMSGLTYVGPAAGGAYTFMAAMEGAKQDAPGTKGVLVKFDLSFNANGAITGISNVAQQLINPIFDFEGIAFTNAARNSVFLSEETNPGIREVNLATTALYQTLTIPPVYTSFKRANFGLESLTRSLDGTQMWTANEEALTVDGALSTAAVGSTVRLLKLDVAGNTVTSGPQYAYKTEPWHGPDLLGKSRSGVSDLVMMPDGTLLTLERSLANSSPLFLDRIYEVGLAGATDVSVGALANGLSGQSYTPATKGLLWSGAVDGASGQNMEGLALGPRLANGNWVLVGVVDDDAGGDPLSQNTIVAFVASATVTGDFDGSGKAGGADFLAWQRGLGKTVGATLAEGDGDRDGDVDAVDLAIWKAASETAVGSPVPEPTAALLLGFAMTAIFAPRRRRLDCSA